MRQFARIVIGLGGVGSAALYHLAQRNVDVLGLDPFPIAHDRGSSHGQTRIIRQAYFEHPAYVPLLRRADALWCALEAASGERLFDRVGLVEVGPPEGIVLPGVRRSVSEHSLPIVSLSAAEAHQRFPQFTVPEGMQAVFEPTAGLLYVERCVAAHVRGARDAGATVVCGEAVERIEEREGQVVVRTDRDDYRAEGVVVCAGPWSPALQLDEIPLRVVRKHLHWFATKDPGMQVDAPCPVFFYERADGFFYGFPAVDELGVKVAEHSGGELVHDPTHVSRQPDPSDDDRILAFVGQCLPQVTAQRLRHAVCMYTMTPDEHFVVDRHPRFERVVFAAGLSGHGFKFAPVLGEILADLSLDGATPWTIDFLRADRF